ncbi:D-alanyl-D-alanine carboxypeptidase family protein [Falsibacillus pallidus]|uniref:D-alanyl-D-alanine carboxypeptidase n=1 Tax=Falsibacillus pallidus TaxID=493781 RepID=A0A370GHC2_9BACI|nr:D-alanyl-D-alanine carboxypeptidase family protein [Falsibacillus pallidus]RDI43198.1 D-alanyl-D-alanine carboxypeptidase [Falsibacillus pallidus]
MKKIVVSFLSLLILGSLAPYSALAAEGEELDIKSEAASVVDAKTGKILYQKNGDKKLYPASLTKIATAIYAIENGHLNDHVVVSHNAANVDGTRVYLLEGEDVTLKHLIQGMLVNSGNDAAIAIAEHLDGSVDEFSKNINAYLRSKVGVYHTHFVNPNGLFDEEHFTTANDLAKITDYAMKNPTFRQIFGTKTLKWHGDGWDTTLITHHKMLKEEIPFPGITGGKTGYVDQSGQTLATTAQNQNIDLTAITLNGTTKKSAYGDTKKLLEYGMTHYKTERVPEGSIFKKKDNAYKAEHDLYFTKGSGENVTKKVEKSGFLKIISKTGEVVAVFPLHELKAKASEGNKDSTSEDSAKKHSSLNLLLCSGIFLLICITILFKKIKKSSA